MIDKEITKKISKEFKGIVWKTWIEQSEDYLLVEDRAVESYQASFSILDLKRNVWIWEDFTFEESWWISIADIYKNIVLFYHYSDSEKPEASDLLAIDIFTREILWQSEKYRFSRIENNTLEVYTQEASNIKYLSLNYETGEVLDKKNDKETQNKVSELYYPQTFKTDTAYFRTVAGFIRKKLNVEVLHLVDYLEYKNLVFLSFFFTKNSYLHNNLLVLDTEAQILLNKTINISKKLAFDTFFLYNKFLIFTENKNKLVIYQTNINF